MRSSPSDVGEFANGVALNRNVSLVANSRPTGWER
jgi:hypothetical protein